MSILLSCDRTFRLDLPDPWGPFSGHLTYLSVEHASRLVEKAKVPLPMEKKKNQGTYQKKVNEYWGVVDKYIIEHSKTAIIACQFSEDYKKPLSKNIQYVCS